MPLVKTPLVQKTKNMAAAITPSLLWISATFILYGFQLTGGWRFDDFHHLLFLTQHQSFEYTYLPEAIRLQSGAHYTPFNILTYDLAHRLFPLNYPSGFYALHLMLLGLACAALYSALSRSLPVWASILGASAFLIGFPTSGISAQLMTGHYVIGFIFSGLFLYHYERSTRQRTPLTLSILFYFLACASKEIFAPLIAIIAIDPRRSLNQRIRLTLLYFFALAAYIILRSLMIGQTIGGYNDGFGNAIPHAIQTIISGIIAHYTSTNSGILLGLISLIVVSHAATSSIYNHGLRATLLIAAGLFAVIVVPLIPVANQVSPNSPTEIRLMTLYWWLFAIISAISTSIAARQWGKTSATIYGLIIIASIAWNTKNHIDHGQLSAINKKFDAYSEYALDQKNCHLIDDMGWSSALADLQTAIYPDRKRSIVAPIEIIQTLGKPGDAICKLENGEITQTGFIDKAKPCDTNARLGAKLHFNGSHITFNFESDETDPWYYIEVPDQYMLKLHDGLKGPWPNHDRLQTFRVLKITSSGNVTCSPMLHFKPDASPELTWRRP